MKFINVILKTITFFLAIQLSACGGGGSAPASPTFTVSTNQINVGVVTNSGQAPDQTISGTVSNYSGPLYIYITHTNNGINTVYLPNIVGNTGTSTISMQSKPQGVYFDTIEVKACSDFDCVNQIAGSPQMVNVTYSIGIAVDPPALNFTAVAGSAPAAQTVTVYYNSNSLSTDTWGSSYLYLDGANWMSYTPADGQSPGEVEVTLSAFPAGTTPGIYNAEIRFGANQGKTLVTLPVKYTIQ